MKRQMRECYLIRLQQNKYEVDEIMGSWHPDFRELMKRLRRDGLDIRARLTVMEGQLGQMLRERLMTSDPELLEMKEEAAWTEEEWDRRLEGFLSDICDLRYMVEDQEDRLYRKLVLYQETLPVPRRKRARARRPVR